jgi:hypothetical protein
VADVPSALLTAGTWLRESQNLAPTAVGHRVVHGGPQYDRPVRIDGQVLAHLERYVSLAPLHQPNNLAPIRALLARESCCYKSDSHKFAEAAIFRGAQKTILVHTGMIIWS